MALDPEELKRQRQLRAQQRAQKAARQRALMIRLGIAAVVLLACGILIFSLVRSAGRQQGESTEATTLPPVQTEASVSTEPLPPTSTIHFVAAGDLNITDKVVKAGGSEYDYTEAFLDVAHLLADADISVLNLEGNLCGAPYGTESKSAPQNLVQALGKAGVDFVQLANSYSINKGVSGLATTIENVRAAGMEPLGVYADQEAYRQGKGYTICYASGIKVGIVAFTKGMDGMTLPPGSENCVNVLYSDYDSTYQTINSEGIRTVLNALEEESPDITIALLHWGSEFNDTISSSQKSIVSLLQQNGVDAIIGTHPHYVQQMKLDPETGMFVAYSLGDFFGDAKRAGSEYSVLLDLEITKDNVTGETKIASYSHTPIFTVAEGTAPLKVVRIGQAMEAYENGYINRVNQATYEAMQYALERIAARLAGE